ncbi:ribosomal protein L21e, partial [Tanacetum coccineum]
MVVRTLPTLSPSMSARIAEAAALSPSSSRKRYRSSYEMPSPSSSPTLPIRIGMVAMAYEVYNEAGLMGLWKGIIPTLIMVGNRIIKKIIHVCVEPVMPSRCTKEFKQKIKKNEQLKAKAKARGEAISSSVPKDSPWDPNLDSWLKALAAKTNGNDVT